MTEELKQIKKYYGEEMMHFCRANFSTILERPGVLFNILDSNFAHDKNIITNLSNTELDQLIKLIVSYCDNNDIDISLANTNKTVEELLKEKDYDFYECNTFEDTKKFKKYYKESEELCTFRDPDRTSEYYVTFVVKKNADKITREDRPQREDDYGTSVMSIQINKNTGTVSIKSRYNHTVNNPDATYTNNLEEINVGLTKAFEKKYNIEISTQKSSNRLYSFVLANDGKLYRFNTQNNLMYFCHNNILIKDNKIITDYMDKSKFLFADDFIIDLQKENSENRIVDLYQYSFVESDYFRKIHKKIDKIEIKQNQNNPLLKNVIFQNENEKPTILTIDNCGNIISYVNPNVKIIGDYFLNHSSKIKHISMENVKYIGENFCEVAIRLNSIEMPNVMHICNNFAANSPIKVISFPNVEHIGYNFITSLADRESVYMPKVEYVGDDFLKGTSSIRNVTMNLCTYLGENSFYRTRKIGFLYMPSLESIPNFAFHNLETLDHYSLTSLKYCSPVSMEHFNINKVLVKNMTLSERFKKTLKKLLT